MSSKSIIPNSSPTRSTLCSLSYSLSHYQCQSIAPVHKHTQPYPTPKTNCPIPILPIPTTLPLSVAHNTKQSYLTGRDKLQGPKGSLQILCVALQVEESTGDRGLQLGGVLPRRRVDGNLVDSSHDCRRRRRRSDGEGVNWEGGWAAASSLSRTDGFLRCRSFSPTGQIARVVALGVGSEVRRLA